MTDVSRRIAVIEDDVTIAAAVADRLRAEGFTVVISHDGQSGLDRCRAERPDLVVLDLMLPGLDGFEVCRRLHQEFQVPVLILTARDEESDLIASLATGADDYLTKPFSPRELVARIRALLRRAELATERSGPRQLGDLVIDEAGRRVWRLGEQAHLSPTEFDLLVCLSRQPGAVRTREQLLGDVWGYRDGSGARTVDSHIRALRRKLGDDVIRTVHGIGYALGDR